MTGDTRVSVGCNTRTVLCFYICLKGMINYKIMHNNCLIFFNYVCMHIYLHSQSASRVPLSPEKHILTSLWFFDHQSSSYRHVADRFEITLSILFDVITLVTDFLTSIAPTVIKYLNSNEKKIT